MAMALHSHVKIYVHLIWGTHRHNRLLTSQMGVVLFKHLVVQSRALNIVFEKINIPPEHIHILLGLPANKSIAQVAKELKGESSNWINDNNIIAGKFRWQRGYGAFSVSASQLEVMKRYIENQNEHHRKKSFKEEY
jgi:putative transposase